MTGDQFPPTGGQQVGAIAEIGEDGLIVEHTAVIADPARSAREPDDEERE